MRRKNVKAKIKQKYGCGIGKDYKPFIRTSEFNSLGTCSNIKDLVLRQEKGLIK